MSTDNDWALTRVKKDNRTKDGKEVQKQTCNDNLSISHFTDDSSRESSQPFIEGWGSERPRPGSCSRSCSCYKTVVSLAFCACIDVMKSPCILSITSWATAGRSIPRLALLLAIISNKTLKTTRWTARAKVWTYCWFQRTTTYVE